MCSIVLLQNTVNGCLCAPHTRMMNPQHCWHPPVELRQTECCVNDLKTLLVCRLQVIYSINYFWPAHWTHVLVWSDNYVIKQQWTCLWLCLMENLLALVTQCTVLQCSHLSAGLVEATRNYVCLTCCSYWSHGLSFGLPPSVTVSPSWHGRVPLLSWQHPISLVSGFPSFID